MLEKHLITQVEDKVLETLLTAQRVFGRTFELPKVEFKDMGRTAGKAYYHDNKIVLSPTLLEENQDTFIERTVIHECGHLINRHVFPFAKQSHGPEWRSVMRRLGSEDVSRCHSYDTSSVAQSRDKWLYTCGCGKRFEFGAARHRRAQSGQYRCGKCKSPCVYTGGVLRA